jgi:hypothetical protein
MYENGKMRPVETIPGMGGGRIQENDGRGELSMIYLTYCKNFYKCHNVPPTQHNNKKNFFLESKLANVIFRLQKQVFALTFSLMLSQNPDTYF